MPSSPIPAEALSFAPGEHKQILLDFSQAEDGQLRISIDSKGLHDDINEVIVMLHLTVEKTLDASSI